MKTQKMQNKKQNKKHKKWVSYDVGNGAHLASGNQELLNEYEYYFIYYPKPTFIVIK
jgi:hypothetical protein